MSPSNMETALFQLVNRARTHPWEYPPHGDPTGASGVDPGLGHNPIVNAFERCHAFGFSQQLSDTARDHSVYMQGQSKDFVSTGDNMHRGPDGKLVWDSGEPMDQAGYHRWRSENVALGFETPEEVVIFWMQDDAPYGWRHRNAILARRFLVGDDVREAGIGYYEGGPWRHYWTLDMGKK
ncbi:CAP domain-containing protein [Streptomyces sp. NPDC056817]|uniref:CAP domain-containing protein n=1 Tax=Streptomyces sp. NPDC056817 TaxID=3345950 RepID=UPI0036B37C55